MAGQDSTTILEYIKAAPPEGQAHLERIYALLKSVAPGATEVIKWRTPFFIEPRFLFSFSGHKAHLNFAPSEGMLEKFSGELSGFRTTKNFLQIGYDDSFPEDLVRRMAEARVKEVREREDDSFW